ncbi:MAG: hypothetical protein D4R93_06630 [Deltaproteobacteria bacterium]|nr:MAG: hypothetical protein D4R93_06630 [Deltaproteobacteria bacterium]
MLAVKVKFGCEVKDSEMLQSPNFPKQIRAYHQPPHNPRTELETIPCPISIEIQLFRYLRIVQVSVFHLEVFDENPEKGNEGGAAAPPLRNIMQIQRCRNFYKPASHQAVLPFQLEVPKPSQKI